MSGKRKLFIEHPEPVCEELDGEIVSSICSSQE